MKSNAVDDAAADDSLSFEASHFALLIVVPDRVDDLHFHLSGRQQQNVYIRLNLHELCGGRRARGGVGGGGERPRCAGGSVKAGFRAAVWSQ